MLERFLSFVSKLPGASHHDDGAAEDARVAATALLVSVMDADGTRHVEEMETLRAALGATFGISGVELERLVASGDEAERRAVDFYGFTSVLSRALDNEGRKAFVEQLWAMVYADGERHEMEDSVVWRIAELLGIDSAERNDIRRRVVAETGGQVKDEP